MSIYLSFFLSIYRSISLSLSIYLSIYLSMSARAGWEHLPHGGPQKAILTELAEISDHEMSVHEQLTPTTTIVDGLFYFVP